MAGRLKLRLSSGKTLTMGLSDAALDYLGVGPEAVFDAQNLLVSEEGISVESRSMDRPGRLLYTPDPLDEMTWAQWFAKFRERMNLDHPICSIDGDQAVAAIAGWEKLEAEFVERASAKEGRRPKKLEPWGIRDEIVGAIAIKVAEGMSLLAAIRFVSAGNPETFSKAFARGTAPQRLQAARRAYYRAALADRLQRDQILATRALASLMLNELPEQVRSRVHQAVHDSTGYVELRTRIETGQTELMLVPMDGSECLWLARI